MKGRLVIQRNRALFCFHALEAENSDLFVIVRAKRRRNLNTLRRAPDGDFAFLGARPAFAIELGTVLLESGLQQSLGTVAFFVGPSWLAQENGQTAVVAF